jgi:hypothetical protein
MPEQLDFHAWWRPGLSALIDARDDGGDPDAGSPARATLRTELELHHTPAGGSSSVAATTDLTAQLAGPLDVAGLESRAIAHRYPAPGTPDAETTAYAYVEFRDPGLPWRYTPRANPDATTSTPLRPWLCLVVGPEDEVSVTGDRVSLGTGTRAAHPLAAAARWCHVQQADGTALSRLLSPLVLKPDTSYVAAVVPTYAPADEDGRLTDAWDAGGADPGPLPCYHHWRFTTGDGGDFRSLALRLTPHRAEDLGRIPTSYPRRPSAPSFEVRGALTSVGTEVPVDPAIITDVEGLRTPAYDDDGRPIVGLPRYGAPWAEVEDTAWGEQLNTDPRHRGIAGLGAEVAAAAEEPLLEEVTRQAGALAAGDRHVRDTALGIVATSRLWDRRLPDDPARQVALFGPGLRRVMTEAGSLAASATGPGRPLPRSALSTAARRSLRRGPARTALADAAASDPRQAFAAANRCPRPQEPEPGVAPPLGKLTPEQFLDAVRRGLEQGIDPKVFDPLFAELRKLTPDEQLVLRLQKVLADRAGAGQPLPLTALVMVAVGIRSIDDQKELARAVETASKGLLEGMDEGSDDADSLRAIVELLMPPPTREETCEPVDVGRLAAAARAAFDPRRDDALALRRLRSTVTGLDPEQLLTPPEFCPGLDVAVWEYVSEQRPSWLLPGLKDAPDDAVLAVTSDATFTTAFLVGFNDALVGRLRWRQQRIASGCTPVRTFWNRVEVTGDEPERLDDIRSIAAWPDDARLGGPGTRPPGVGSSDLVLVLSGQLLLRYPKTVVYLVAKADDGGMDQHAPSVFPSFRGRIGNDAVFLGFPGLTVDDLAELLVVVEEAPSGYRFHNDPSSSADDGAQVAHDVFANPIRVLIPGANLTPEEDT